MSEKDLKINFRYLAGNIACMSVDSIDGKPVHNDIDNEEAIILFNSLVGEKESRRTVKTLLQENKQLKEVIKEVRELKDEYVCTEEYCGEAGIETTKFIEKLGQTLDKGVKND